MGVQGCQKGNEPGKTDTIKLKFSSSSMPAELPNIQATRLLDLVEEKTGGRVKVERYMGGSLAGPLEHLDLLVLPEEETRAYCEILSRYSMTEWLSNAAGRELSDKAAVIQKY